MVPSEFGASPPFNEALFTCRYDITNFVVSIHRRWYAVSR